MDEARFEKLLILFKAAYLNRYGKTRSEKQQANHSTFSLLREEDLLYYTLFSLKSGLSYDSLGVIFGIKGSNAKRNQQTGLKLLNLALEGQGYLPKRQFTDKKDFEAYLSELDTLLLDTTEQPIQRPSDEEEQKAHYSGKKKPYL